MKHILQNANVAGKRVLLRCDFNVPMVGGRIVDPTKILRSLKTIEYLVSQNCKIILLSHFGKVKSTEDKQKNTLKPVAAYLGKVLGTQILFSTQPRSNDIPNIVSTMRPGQILMLENTRFEDCPNKLESSNNPELAAFWASLADVFVMDAFGSAHRAHASTVGVANILPSYAGFLVQEELEALDEYVINAKRPFALMMGGAKVEEKLGLIENLIDKCDYLLLSGGLANSCLKALGFDIGSSLSTNKPEVLERLKELMRLHKEKIILPLDAIVGNTYNKSYVEYKTLKELEPDDMMLDIGIKTIEKFKTAIGNCQTVFLNGTVGKYEDIKFSNGTKEILRVLKESNASVIVGGGESVSAVKNLGYDGAFTYLSSGGGATLEYLAKQSLPALEAVEKEKDYEVLDLES